MYLLNVLSVVVYFVVSPIAICVTVYVYAEVERTTWCRDGPNVVWLHGD